MTGAWFTADEIITMIDVMVLKLGEEAFLHNGKAHLYSGPSYEVRKQILGKYQDNFERAKKWAKDHNAKIIDDTIVGNFLNNFGGVGLYDYFDVNPFIKPGHNTVEAAKVWTHASRLFIAALAPTSYVIQLQRGWSWTAYLCVKLPDYWEIARQWLKRYMENTRRII